VTFELILIGLVITLEPIPLTAFILVLASKRGVRKGAAFVFGWLLSLAIVIAATVLITGNKPPKPSTSPSLGALALKIAIGVALVLIAVRQRRKMGQPKKPKKTPKWQTGIDNMSPLYAMGLAPLTQPWGLVAAGVADIVGAKLSSWQSYIALFLTMEIYAGFRPEQSRAFVLRVKTWIDTHTDQIIVIGSLLLGFWLIGKSIYLVVTT
jgi:threonine/homoserine/homoserine lactone efflux protein